MPETTEPQLSESDVRRIESHLHLTTDADVVSVLAEVPALIRDWRALRAALRAEDKDHRLTIDTFRQQERIWQEKFDEQESGNAALREQLAQAEKERDSLRYERSRILQSLERAQKERNRLKEDLRILTQGRFIKS